MLYRDKKTGTVVDVSGTLSGSWEAVEPAGSQKAPEAKPAEAKKAAAKPAAKKTTGKK